MWAQDGKYTIRRIIYEGGDNIDNEAPDAEIEIEDRVFSIQESINFDGSSSSDPDQHDLSYKWDFGDGEISTKATKTKSYHKEGKYTVTLTVTDEKGFKDSTSKTVMVGQPPVPVIESPKAGVTFAVDEVFTLIGHAHDSNGKSLTDLDLTWEVRQMHNTHYHPFLDSFVGNGITIPPAPSPEDFNAATNSFLRILLTATDSNGLTSTVTRDIMPTTKLLYFKTDPPGLRLTIEGFNIKTPDDSPLEIISWLNHNITIDVNDQDDMIFDGWSNGIRARHTKDQVRENYNEIRTAKFLRLDVSKAIKSMTDYNIAVSEYKCGSICKLLSI